MESHRILIVDDESSLRKVLADLLSLRGYDTASVGSCPEALEKAGNWSPEVAIVDLQMEHDRAGLDLIRDMKGVAPDTACIILTGFASAESRREADELGVISYLEKPFDVGELLQALRMAMEKRPAAPAPAAVPTNGSARGSQLVEAIRRDCITPLTNIITLAGNIQSTNNIQDARSFARIVQTEARATLENLGRLLDRADRKGP